MKVESRLKLSILHWSFLRVQSPTNAPSHALQEILFTVASVI